MNFHDPGAMGTSTARRAPRTSAWRAAKTAATRYLSPEGGTPAAALEVAAKYLAALADAGAASGAELVGEFVRTRKAAQELGAALEAGSDLSSPLPADGSLEAAVVETALASYGRALALGAPSGPREPARGVAEFLAMVLSRRLLLDLGEPLEAAAPDCRSLRQGAATLGELIAEAAREAMAAGGPVPSGQWRGLAGWVWVTRVLTALGERLKAG